MHKNLSEGYAILLDSWQIYGGEPELDTPYISMVHDDDHAFYCKFLFR